MKLATFKSSSYILIVQQSIKKNTLILLTGYQFRLINLPDSKATQKKTSVSGPTGVLF